MMRPCITVILALSLLSACSRPATFEKIDQFTESSADNARIVANLVEQLCIEGMAEEGNFLKARNASGWEFRKTQNADLTAPLSLEVWETDGLTVVRSPHFNTPFRTCYIGVFDERVPSARDASRALTRMAGTQGKGTLWEWKPAYGQRVIMDMSEGVIGGRTGISIMLETYDIGLGVFGL